MMGWDQWLIDRRTVVSLARLARHLCVNPSRLMLMIIIIIDDILQTNQKFSICSVIQIIEEK